MKKKLFCIHYIKDNLQALITIEDLTLKSAKSVVKRNEKAKILDGWEVFEWNWHRKKRKN